MMQLNRSRLSGSRLRCFEKEVFIESDKRRAWQFCAAISALLKEMRGATVLLTSFIVSAAVIPIIDAFITMSKSGTDQNLLALPFIDQSLRLKSILPPSPLSVSFFIALASCVIFWAFLKYTFFGRKIQVWGSAPRFAQYCGYSSSANTYVTLCASGALHAAAGFFAVCGTYYTCHKGFYSGMGWNALSASLLASSNPLALIVSSLVLSWLFTATDMVALTQGFGFDISGIIQGIVLFSIAIPVTINTIRGKK